MKCDYCGKKAMLSLCRLEENPRTNETEHYVYKAFCWEDAVKRGIFVYEEPKGGKPITLTSDEVIKGTRTAASGPPGK